MSVHQAASQIKARADTACWAIHRPNGFSYVFAPTDHDFTFIHKAFACRPKKFLLAQTLLNTFPSNAGYLSGKAGNSKRGLHVT